MSRKREREKMRKREEFWWEGRTKVIKAGTVVYPGFVTPRDIEVSARPHR